MTISNNLNVEQINNNIVLSNVNNFDLQQTLDCGQAFRWTNIKNDLWFGVAFEKELFIEKCNGKFVLYDTTIDDYLNIWENYFDFKRDYSTIIESLKNNDVLYTAANENSGIRILKQDKWETVCSFIISQNNNIPRIKGIIERLCQMFGNKTLNGYSFPNYEVISKLTQDDLAPIKSGFRARYILDAANKFKNNEIDFNVAENSDIEDARSELKKIVGVGDKVADCALLFAFSRIEAFPKDVWIKRALNILFEGKIPEEILPYAGIIQQYIFNYVRTNNILE